MRLFLLFAAGITLFACHPGNREAKRLGQACDSGDVKACNALGFKLQKGEYVLRDVARAAIVFKRACEGDIGDSCAALGGMYLRGSGVTRDSSRAPELFRPMLPCVDSRDPGAGVATPGA